MARAKANFLAAKPATVKKTSTRVSPRLKATRLAGTVRSTKGGARKLSRRDKSLRNGTRHVQHAEEMEVVYALSPDERQYLMTMTYRRISRFVQLVNHGALDHTDGIYPMPIMPAIGTLAEQEWEGKDIVLPLPKDFVAVIRGDLLALPNDRIGKILKDYGLALPADQDEWIDVLLDHLHAPTRADAAACIQAVSQQ